jgi:hypothetical protein
MVSMKKGCLISAVLFTISVVLLFLLPVYTVTTVTVLGQVNEIEINWITSYGLIIAQSLVILGVIASAIKSVKFLK